MTATKSFGLRKHTLCDIRWNLFAMQDSAAKPEIEHKQSPQPDVSLEEALGDMMDKYLSEAPETLGRTSS